MDGEPVSLLRAMPRPVPVELAAVGVHTATMLLAMGAIAVLVLEKVGLAILRRAWFNLDRVWAFTLIGSGGLTLLF